MNEKNEYIDMIVKQIKAEKDISEVQLSKIKNKLKTAPADDLDRICDMFNRFGVEAVFKNMKG